MLFAVPSSVRSAALRAVHVAAALMALATLFIVQPARADGSMRLQINWSQTFERGTRKLGIWRNAKSEDIRAIHRGPTQYASGAFGSFDGSPWSRRPEGDIGSALVLDVPTNSTPWFGVGPEVSLVVRDWGSAKAIMGGEIAVTDAIRPSHSFRMALARVRLGSGRITPFAQFGAGAYRLDNDVVATRMRDTEVAAQVGGGIEVHMVKNRKVEWDLAAESCLTQILRDDREPQNVSMTRMYSGLIASRIRF